MNKIYVTSLLIVGVLLGGLFVWSDSPSEDRGLVPGASAVEQGTITMRAGNDINLNPTTPGNFEAWGGNVNNATYVNTSYVIGDPAILSYDVYVYIDGSDVVARYRNGSIIYTGTTGTNDAAAINAGISMLDTYSRSIKMSGYFSLESTVNISVDRMLFDASGAAFKPAANDTDLFNLSADNMIVEINRIYGNSKTGCRGIVLSGSNANTLNINTLHFISDGIVIEGAASSLGNDINFNMLGGCDYGISLLGDDVQGTVVRGNFLTGNNYSIYMNSSAVCHYNVFDVDAIDPIGYESGVGDYGVYVTGSGAQNYIRISGFWDEAEVYDLYDDSGRNYYSAPSAVIFQSMSIPNTSHIETISYLTDCKYISANGLSIWSIDSTNPSGPYLDFWASAVTTTPVGSDPVARIQGLRTAPGAVGNLVFYVRDYDGTSSLNEALRIYANLTAEFAGDIYVTGACSAESFVDRTPGYTGDDALGDIRGIRNTDDGQIDHSTLPEFIRVNSTDSNATEGRDIGNTVTLLVAAVQQLDEENRQLKELIAELS